MATSHEVLGAQAQNEEEHTHSCPMDNISVSSVGLNHNVGTTVSHTYRVDSGHGF